MKGLRTLLLIPTIALLLCEQGLAANACDREIKEFCSRDPEVESCESAMRRKLTHAMNDPRIDMYTQFFQEDLEYSLRSNNHHMAPYYRCALAELDKLSGRRSSTKQTEPQNSADKNPPVTNQSQEKALPAEAKAQEKLHQATFAYYEELGREVDGENSLGKKRVVLPQYPKCLKAVDIKEDSDVKNMYWYSIQNTCEKKLRVLWCEGVDCKPTTKAWDIPAGEKERSWMTSRIGVRGVAFHGTACQLSYQGRDVYYNMKKAQCWAWDR